MMPSSPGTTLSTVATPAPTATIITVKPIATPSMCGMVGRKPKLIPDAISIRLLGPGVIDETSAKAASTRSRADVISAAYAVEAGG